jgi:peptidoglycan/LPS O-acetylase OafA/YrhL
LNNFDVHPECTTSVGMAWSVAIEEQFYLVWPLIFMLLIRKPVILIIFCFLLLILSLCYNYGYPISSYFHTFGNIIYLMTGCLGAILFVKKNEFITKKKWMNKGTFFLSLILIFVIVAMRISFAEFILPVIYIYIVIYLVVMEDHSKRINVFSRLGKYTFGMYMYHPTLILLFKIAFDKLGYDYHENKGAHALMAILVLVSTIAISWVSYEFFEKKILQFKSQFASIKTRV